MSIQSYDINLGPAGANNSTQIIEASGQIFDFLSSGSAFDVIEVRPDIMQGASQLKQGQGFDAGSMINRWLVVNKGATAIAGTVIISTAGFRNFRISGDVNVLDGGKSRTLNASAFSMVGAALQTAGVYGKVALFNPVGSVNRLALKSVTLADGATAVSANVVPITAALTSSDSGPLPSKLVGPSRGASSGHIQTDITAVAQSVVPSFTQLSAPSSGNQTYTFQEPIVILPGYGVALWSNSINAYLAGTFEWIEEPNT